MVKRVNIRATFSDSAPTVGGVPSSPRRPKQPGPVARPRQPQTTRGLEEGEEYSPSAWRYFHGRLLENLPLSQDIFDYAFEYEYLINREELGLDEANLLNNPPFIKNDPEYNFHISGYEDTISRQSPNVPETLLPNIYVFGSEIASESLDEDQSDYSKHLTLNGRIENVFSDILSDKSNQKIGESDSGEYFNKYVTALKNIPAGPLPADLASFAKKFKNTVFSSDALNLLKDYNARKSLFPMYTEVSFKTDSFTEMAQLLKDAFLTGDLIKYVIETNPEDMQVAKSNFTITNEGQESNNTSETIESWDIMRWVESVKNGDPAQQTSGTEDIAFMAGSSGETQIASDPSSRFFRKLMITLFYSKLVELSKNRLRTMQEVLEGGLAPSEAVFYEVKKYEGDLTIPENAIQSFFFANSNELDVLDFVDTQVKYNKNYTYEIFAYQMVLGNAYRYMSPEVTDTTVELNVENNAKWMLFKVKLNEFTNRVVDRPPVFPDVDIIPYKGVNDKILLSLNSGVGFITADPVEIRDEDVEKIEVIRQSQKKPTGPLEYKTDDKTSFFEIYRTDVKPTSYSDFSTARRIPISTEFGPGGPLLSAANYVDTIIPNKVYYYTFRAADIHGQCSNPTPIYSVKMVDNSGVIYPLIEVVELEEPGSLNMSKTKSGKRFVQLIPAIPQTIFNGDTEKTPFIGGGFDAIPLGVQPEKVWNKDYKVRFISKKTGRKFDVNVKFRHKGNKYQIGEIRLPDKISLDYIRDLSRLPGKDD